MRGALKASPTPIRRCNSGRARVLARRETCHVTRCIFVARLKNTCGSANRGSRGRDPSPCNAPGAVTRRNASRASPTRCAGAILPTNMALASLTFPALSAITALPAFILLVSGTRLHAAGIIREQPNDAPRPPLARRFLIVTAAAHCKGGIASPRSAVRGPARVLRLSNISTSIDLARFLSARGSDVAQPKRKQASDHRLCRTGSAPSPNCTPHSRG